MAITQGLAYRSFVVVRRRGIDVPITKLQRLVHGAGALGASHRPSAQANGGHVQAMLGSEPMHENSLFKW
ncbi:hypothetical protein D3C76_1452450 [compost metagenome]